MIRAKFMSNGKRKSTVSRAELGTVLQWIKKRMSNEPDEFKKQTWAEVGIELNRIYLHLGIRDTKSGK